MIVWRIVETQIINPFVPLIRRMRGTDHRQFLVIFVVHQARCFRQYAGIDILRFDVAERRQLLRLISASRQAIEDWVRYHFQYEGIHNILQEPGMNMDSPRIDEDSFF